jgi:hypothetical protein
MQTPYRVKHPCNHESQTHAITAPLSQGQTKGQTTVAAPFTAIMTTIDTAIRRLLPPPPVPVINAEAFPVDVLAVLNRDPLHSAGCKKATPLIYPDSGLLHGLAASDCHRLQMANSCRTGCEASKCLSAAAAARLQLGDHSVGT